MFHHFLTNFTAIETVFTLACNYLLIEKRERERVGVVLIVTLASTFSTETNQEAMLHTPLRRLFHQ